MTSVQKTNVIQRWLTIRLRSECLSNHSPTVCQRLLIVIGHWHQNGRGRDKEQGVGNDWHLISSRLPSPNYPFDNTYSPEGNSLADKIDLGFSKDAC